MCISLDFQSNIYIAVTVYVVVTEQSLHIRHTLSTFWWDNTVVARLQVLCVSMCVCVCVCH
jgi:hypothetical protein